MSGVVTVTLDDGAQIEGVCWRQGECSKPESEGNQACGICEWFCKEDARHILSRTIAKAESPQQRVDVGANQGGRFFQRVKEEKGE